MKRLKLSALAIVLMLFGLMIPASLHASGTGPVGPSTANATLNITVSQSVTVSVSPNTLTASYSSGNIVFSGLTVNSSWNTDGSEDEYLVYASFGGSATAFTNGSSTIPAANVSATVTGSTSQGLDYCNGTAFGAQGGVFTQTISQSCGGGPAFNFSNAVPIFQSNINNNVAGAPNTNTGAHPSGTSSNTVVITVVPTAQMVAGTYTGNLVFSAEAN